MSFLTSNIKQNAFCKNLFMNLNLFMNRFRIYINLNLFMNRFESIYEFESFHEQIQNLFIKNWKPDDLFMIPSLNYFPALNIVYVNF